MGGGGLGGADGGSRVWGRGGRCALTPLSFSPPPQTAGVPRMVRGGPGAPWQPRVSGTPPPRRSERQPCAMFGFPVLLWGVMGGDEDRHSLGGARPGLTPPRSWGAAPLGDPRVTRVQAGWGEPLHLSLGLGGVKGPPWVFVGADVGGLVSGGTAGRGSRRRWQQPLIYYLAAYPVSGTSATLVAGPPAGPPGVSRIPWGGGHGGGGAVSMATGLRFPGNTSGGVVVVTPTEPPDTPSKGRGCPQGTGS